MKIKVNCLQCNTGKFEWANKSGDYKRDLSDWLRLCISCHRKYDFFRLKNGKGVMSYVHQT